MRITVRRAACRQLARSLRRLCLRGAVVAAVLGTLAVPVECAMVAGPHSVFLGPAAMTETTHQAAASGPEHHLADALPDVGHESAPGPSAAGMVAGPLLGSAAHAGHDTADPHAMSMEAGSPMASTAGNGHVGSHGHAAHTQDEAGGRRSAEVAPVSMTADHADATIPDPPDGRTETTAVAMVAGGNAPRDPARWAQWSGAAAALGQPAPVQVTAPEMVMREIGTSAATLPAQDDPGADGGRIERLAPPDLPGSDRTPLPETPPPRTDLPSA